MCVCVCVCACVGDLKVGVMRSRTCVLETGR